MDYDNFSFLGKDLERCFEIDSTVGIAIVNLKQRIDVVKPIFHVRFMSEVAQGAAFYRTIEYFNEENDPIDNTISKLIKLLYINEGKSFNDWYSSIDIIEDELVKLDLRTRN